MIAKRLAPLLLRALPLSLSLALPLPAAANDSASAIGIGGLVLTRSAAISMDAEDLYLSRDEVRVRYRFTNRSDKDVETLVSFPVPDLPGGVAEDLGDRDLPDYRELQFRTTVDGKPVKLDYVERVEVGGRDVTRRLAQLGWPARWNLIDYDRQLAFLDTMSEADKQAYVREGLLRRSAEHDMLLPAWNLVTYVTRKQVFPAGKTVEVTHRYVPLAGGSVGGGLDPEYRKESDFFAHHVKHFCLDPAFMAAFDRRHGTGPQEKRLPYMEHWLHYILSSGANWRGPIGDFRLVVDKGKPDNLVSFCMDGVRKISPTQFEVRKRGFEPKSDIHVLIVEWAKPGE